MIVEIECGFCGKKLTANNVIGNRYYAPICDCEGLYNAVTKVAQKNNIEAEPSASDNSDYTAVLDQALAFYAVKEGIPLTVDHRHKLAAHLNSLLSSELRIIA